MAVQDGRAERAIVPIENSLEGSVSATLDALAFETDRVRIVGEVVHPIRHSLIARVEMPQDAIERVISHPQASAQCSRFIRARLPAAEVISTSSTAEAVRIVAGSDRPWAALGTRLAADIYDCVVLEEGVEDVPENETRFVWLGRESENGESENGESQNEDPSIESARWKTSVVFWGLPDAPGALVGVLQEFAERGINLTKIESRPRKQGLGRYIFFIDMEGREDDEDVRTALGAVGAVVETLRVLGCYPAA
jgi:prephenate dehydratase